MIANTSPFFYTTFSLKWIYILHEYSISLNYTPLFHCKVSCEVNSIHNDFAVAVWKNDNVTDYVTNNDLYLRVKFSVDLVCHLYNFGSFFFILVKMFFRQIFMIALSFTSYPN